ncbi:MAG: hypothetical protein PHP30_09865 [Bacteroidales bacterium]|nr:hypothetical protein [Bacteroidales bacterium]MDD2426300.1 hypothetical protein [Bacteroidales bacterium]MDD3990382.1 hypothetical protein [Bacteroidales bacterium]
MKKFILTAVILAGSLFAPATAQAQIDIRVNIGLQPIWGPAGYDYVEYYYIPELDIYYYVPGKQFIYMVNGRWIASVYLPSFLENFDFFRTRVVVLNEYRPYLRHREIRRMYSNHWDIRPYITIRDIREPKYYVNIHHPLHKYWQERERDRYDDYNRNRRDNDRNPVWNGDRNRDYRDRWDIRDDRNNRDQRGYRQSDRYDNRQSDRYDNRQSDRYDNRQDNRYNDRNRGDRENRRYDNPDNRGDRNNQRYNNPDNRGRETTKERERVGAGQGGSERPKSAVQKRETPKSNTQKRETPKTNNTQKRESSGSVYRRTGS